MFEEKIMTAKKTKTLQYRKVDISDKSKNLYSLLLEALRKLTGPQERSEEIGKDTDLFRLINQYHSTQKLIFGEFLVYEKGASQPILSKDEKIGATHFPVKYIQIKDVSEDFS